MNKASFFENLPPADPDPIFALNDRFRKDPNPGKINLGIGVYQDDHGRTPFINVVRKAYSSLVEQGGAAGYLPIDGNPAYISAVQQLIFPGMSLLKEGRVAAAQTPGGTGALRVLSDFLRNSVGVSLVSVSNPTWVNHSKIFQAAGLTTMEYPYLAADGHSLDFDAMREALSGLASGTAVLLHACCHNPTGVDLNVDQWKDVASICATGGLIPFFDFAYQGFASGVEDDGIALRLFAEKGIEYVAAYSFSKNFSLYGERQGALIVVTNSAERTGAALSGIKAVIRANYSNPPTFGSRVVSHVLDDPDLRTEWVVEVDGMRERIRRMRTAFVEGLDRRGVSLPYILEQNGMFSYTGLKPAHTERLEKEFSVYLVKSGRMCVAALNPGNIDYVCDSVAAVLR